MAAIPPDTVRRRLVGAAILGPLILGPLVLAAGCGFEPVHAPAPGGAAPARSRIAVDVVPGSAGFALRERLVERLGAASAPSHRLAVDLDLRTESAAITQDNITTRFLVIGAARFRLLPVGAVEPVLDETVSAQTGYSAPASDTASAYASRVAARDAEERLARTLADRIALRLAAADRSWSDRPASTP